MFALNVSVITQPCYFLWGLFELIGMILSHHRGTSTIIIQITNNYMSKEGALNSCDLGKHSLSKD